MLALPQRGAADPPAHVVPAHRPLPGGERPPPRRFGGGGRLGRDLALDPALHPRSWRRRGGRPHGSRRGRADRLHAARRRRRAGELPARLATPPGPRGLDRGRGRARAARRAAFGRLGAQCARREVRAPGRDRRGGDRALARARVAAARLAPGRRPLRSDRGAGHPGGRRGRRGDRRPRRGPGGGGDSAGDDGRAGDPAGGALPGRRLLDLPAALLGDADPDRPLRFLRGRAGARGGPAGRPAPRRRADRGGQPAGRAVHVRRRRLPALRGAGQARDRHARLPLRRALALGAVRGAAGGARDRDVHPPRAACLAALRAARRRRRQRWLRLRPADRDQGPARYRPVRVHRARASPSAAASSTRW